MKLFLDDQRNPRDCVSYMYTRIGKDNPIYLEDWVVVRSYDEFRDVFLKHSHEITHISFDHDLSDEHYDPEMMVTDGNYNELYKTFKEKTGLECARLVKEFYDEYELPYPVMYVHSMNPIGTMNIINVFKQ